MPVKGSAANSVRLGFALVCFLLSTTAIPVSADDKQASDYVPPELQASDPEIKGYIEAAQKLGKGGDYHAAFEQLQKGLEVSSRKGILADQALLEAKLGGSHFVEGRLEEAKKYLLAALEDSIKSENLVLQADTLVALSSLEQTTGDLPKALDLMTRSLALARKSKNFWIQSRSLGELALLQLTMGKPSDARASLEEALQIDRLNQYSWEAEHILYLGWLTGTDPSKLDDVMQLAGKARDLAIKHDDYLVFMQASTSLAHGYVLKGELTKSISLLEHSRDGIDENGKPLFSNPDSYRAAMSLPYPSITFLESLALAYENAKQPEVALKAWLELYQTSSKAGFNLATAEAAHKIADLYQQKKAFVEAISYYLSAAEYWAKVGNSRRQIDALASEAFLLGQQKENEKAVSVYQALLPLTRSTNQPERLFLFTVSIAELLQPEGDVERSLRALQDAESLLSPDLTLPNLPPRFVLELYVRLAQLQAKRNDPLEELIALEKAMTPAGQLDAKAMSAVDAAVKEALATSHARETADRAYTSGDYLNALTYLELIEHFEETDAAWNGKSAEFAQEFDKNQNITHLLQLPSQIIARPGGADFLEANLQKMGPIAKAIRLPTLMVLAGRYMMEQQQDRVVQALTAALPYINPQQPHPWDVMIVCNLALSLAALKNQDAAAAQLSACLQSAEKLADPKLLAIAHQTNVFVLGMAGKSEKTTESAQYLLQHTPDDPLQYAQLAQIQMLQHNSSEAIANWQKALSLFEARKDLSQVASAHLAIADCIESIPSRSDEQQNHLESALSIYKDLGDLQGQAKASLLLGKYFTAKKDFGKARSYFDAAQALAHEASNKGLEGDVLSEIGQSYVGLNQPARALDSFRKAAELYHAANNLSNEAWQLRWEALALNDLHRTEEGLETALKAEHVADASGSWVPRYWTRRLIAEGYQNRGDYENAIAMLREALSISDSANQPQNSAWAELALSAAFTTLGDWDEALDEINLALPVVQKSNDPNTEFLAYTGLIDIYGARESGLKDLDKALEYYQAASQLVGNSNPDRAASLALAVEEIYWQQKRFKEAIIKASDALAYYQQIKDDWDTASALITLAEAQRSNGNVDEAKVSLARAVPLVQRVSNTYMTGRLYYGQANLAKQQGHFNDAIAQYERVISLLEQIKGGSDESIREKIAETYSFIYDELVDTYYLLAAENQQARLSAAEKALSYTELNKSRIFTTSWGRSFLDSLRRQLPAELQEKKRILAARRAALQSELALSTSGQGNRLAKQINEDLRRLAQDETALEHELRQANPGYAEARFPQGIAIADVPVHAGETLVEFKLLDDKVLVWLISGGPAGPQLTAFYKVDHSRQWFQERVLEIRNAFNRGQPDQFDPAASEELFNALFPATSASSLTSAKSLIFVPDDVLFLLPMEVLSPEATKSSFQLLKTSTVYFPSAAAFRLSRATQKSGQKFQAQFLGIADPITSSDDERYAAAATLAEIGSPPTVQVKDAQSPLRGDFYLRDAVTRDYFFSRLPETAVEIKGIAGLFAADPAASVVRTGFDTRKRDLLQTDLGRFRFIHFATHGFFPVEPGIREPALVLSYDGKNQQQMFLTLTEILRLKLHAEMVVLSACNTGSGKATHAEGVSSLGRAFLSAGASSVAMTLWKVSDKSTAMLMQEFYHNLLAGMPKAQALAQARSTLAAKGYGNPFYWAPFVLMGE